MTNNLIETAKNYFDSEFINEASTALGERKSGISKAISAIIPISLIGILKKATSDTDGSKSIFNIAKESSSGLVQSPTLSSFQNQESKGKNILTHLFGDSQTNIVDSISQFADIKDSSSSSLLNMAMPVILGLIGKQSQQNNFTPNDLTNSISSQKDNILDAMPNRMAHLLNIFEVNSVKSNAANMSTILESKFTSEQKPSVINKPYRSSSWLLPLFVIIVIIAGLFFFLRSCNKNTEKISLTNTTKTIINTETEIPVIKKTALKVKLPNGKNLFAFKGGLEDQLVTFLNSNWKLMSNLALKEKWFDFDNLNFETGKATLLSESENQLDNLAEILKAYPDTKIKIGGYTDASGNATFNKKLSLDRATAAKNGLIKRGVGSQVISAEGYGSQFAKVAATAPYSEKAFDRHVSVSVRK